ncbi:MAG: ABC transporter ATP-binding protein [Clostridiaceae bacterium]|nr:ABC transporter ATP-binding protein [Clostridiaceae bacterium]
MALLTAENISYFYQDGDARRYILRDIDYTYEKGKFYTILGESGSGKTTFLSLLGGMDEPKTGTIRYEGEDIRKTGYDKFRRNKVGFVFQNFNLVPFMTAVENLLVAMSITENTIPSEKKEIAYNLLDFVGIDRIKADRTVNRLSGGEQQRVAIARSISTNVDIVLADEPTGNLDEDTENEIVGIFKELAHRFGKCVIVVTHSTEIAQQSDQVAKLKKGVLRVDE